MRVVKFHCPACEDTWMVPRPDEPRRECLRCGGPLDVNSMAVSL